MSSSSRFGFLTTVLTSQVISIAFYSEREKSDKFCSEALISAWVSFTYRKSKTRDPRLYSGFLRSEKSVDPGRVWIRRPRIQWWVWQGKVNSICYSAQAVNPMLLSFLWQEDDVHIRLLRWNVLFVVYNCPVQHDPQISRHLSTYGTWWNCNRLIRQSLPQPLPNCDNGWKMLGTIYRRMTFDIFMNVFMRNCTPILPAEGATLFIGVTVLAFLTVTCVLHLVRVCYIDVTVWAALLWHVFHLFWIYHHILLQR